MAEEISNAVVPVQSETKVAPNLESELDLALSKVFEDQQPKTELKNEKEKAPKAEEPKPEVHTEAIKEEVKPTQEVDAEATDDYPKTPKNKSGWEALKNSAKAAKALAETKESEIKKLKETLAEKGALTTKEAEAFKTQIEELSKYRAMVDIQADPEFISQFDQPINKSKESIKQMLVDLDVTQDVVDKIDFSNTKLLDQIIGHVGEHKDKFIAKKLEREIDKLLDLSDKRDETLAEKKEKYKEYIETKKKENFSKEAEGEGRMFKHLETIASAKDEKGNPRVPFLSKITPNPDATQPQIEQIDRHNNVVDLMRQKLDMAIKANTPEGRAEVAVAATAAHWLDSQLKSAVAKIKSLEAEIAKISNVSDETEKTKVKVRSSNGNGNEMDLDSALASHFAKR